MLTRLAFKNIWRNKARSLIVIVAITLGLAGGLLTVAIITGMIEQKVRESISIETSHLQIHHRDFLRNYESQYSVAGADSLAQVIAKMPAVKAVTTRNRITGMIASPNAVSGIQIVGVDPDREKKLSTLYQTIPDSCGGYFPGNRRNQVLIGSKLAEKLKVRLKSKVVVRFQDTDGNLTEAAFTITGIFRTPNTVFDETNVFVKKNDLARLFSSDPGIQEMAVMLNDIKDLDAVEPALKSRFPALEVKSWTELRPEMGMITSAIAMEVYIILAIILFALAFGIVNTMLMMVFDRTRELGMLMAVGMSRRRVFRMIMMETIFMTAIGGVAGMALSLALIGWFRSQGIDLSSFSKGLGAFGFDPKIYPFIPAKMYFHLTLMILATGILAAIMPARKALRLNPVEAIRTE
jgi:putative ABC transport system permease protein